MHVARAGADAVAADIGVMDASSRKSRPACSLWKIGTITVMSKKCAGREPRIVGDQHVARLERLRRKRLDEMLAGRRERVDVAGRAGDGLRDHAAAPVEQRVGKVASLAHDRAECDALQRLAPARSTMLMRLLQSDLELDAVHVVLTPYDGHDAAGRDPTLALPAWKDDDGGLAFLDDGGAADGLIAARVAGADRPAYRRRRRRSAPCAASSRLAGALALSCGRAVARWPTAPVAIRRQLTTSTSTSGKPQVIELRRIRSRMLAQPTPTSVLLARVGVEPA